MLKVGTALVMVGALLVGACGKKADEAKAQPKQSTAKAPASDAAPVEAWSEGLADDELEAQFESWYDHTYPGGYLVKEGMRASCRRGELAVSRDPELVVTTTVSASVQLEGAMGIEDRSYDIEAHFVPQAGATPGFRCESKQGSRDCDRLTSYCIGTAKAPKHQVIETDAKGHNRLHR